MFYEPGTYRGTITNWGLTKAKTGTPQFFVTFDILGKVDQSAPDAQLISCQAGERTIFRAITDKTIEWITGDLEQLGYPFDSFDQLERQHAAAHDFAGIEIPVRCEPHVYEGKASESWSFAWGGGGKFEATPPNKSEVSKLNALFGKKMKAARTAPVAVAGKPSHVGGPVGRPVAATGDIPF